MMDELRVALLKNWRALGFRYPVYGVLDAEELALDSQATLVLDSGHCCLVQAEDVLLLPGVDVQDLVPGRYDSWARRPPGLTGSRWRAAHRAAGGVSTCRLSSLTRNQSLCHPPKPCQRGRGFTYLRVCTFTYLRLYGSTPCRFGGTAALHRSDFAAFRLSGSAQIRICALVHVRLGGFAFGFHPGQYRVASTTTPTTISRPSTAISSASM